MDDFARSTQTASPLVVDVDGTLLRTDLLYEAAAALLFRKPWLLPLLPVWLLGGRAALKRKLNAAVEVDVTALPVNEALLEWLQAEKARGRALYLVSASDETVVRRLAGRFGNLFDGAYGSDGTSNLAGAKKLAFIRAQIGAEFSYAGDERRDLAIWEECRSAVLVGAGCALRNDLSPQVKVVGEFAGTTAGAMTWVRALRMRQWAKNLLLFVPLLLSGHGWDAPRVLQVMIGFAAFSLMTSATYLLNDLSDLAADRLHRSKSQRPLASGELPLRSAFLALPLLVLAVVGLLTQLPAMFGAVALLYLVVTLSYSFTLKRRPILDLLCLAMLYSVRIVAGMVASLSVLSPWLLVFAMFFFTSLAAVKRYSECLVAVAENKADLAGRGYRAADGPVLMSLGIASGFCASLVFFLYLVDPASPSSRYPHPQMLWCVCVILAYWLGRVWLLAGRGEMHDDPVAFALRDRTSLFLAAACVLLAVSATV